MSGKRNAELASGQMLPAVARALADQIATELEREVAALKSSGELRGLVSRALAKAAERGAERDDLLVSAVAGLLVLHVRRSRGVIEDRISGMLDPVRRRAALQLGDRPEEKGPIHGSAGEE